MKLCHIYVLFDLFRNVSNSIIDYTTLTNDSITMLINLIQSTPTKNFTHSQFSQLKLSPELLNKKKSQKNFYIIAN